MQDLKIFVGFCGADDDPQAQLAASGALATISAVPEVAAAIVANDGVEPLVEMALIAERPELVHRAAVALERLATNATDAIFGPKDSEDDPPAHALGALGAISVLSRSAVEPARRAAVSALVALGKARPDLQPPPAEAVQKLVETLKEEAAKRREAEAAEEAEAAARAAAEAAEEEERKKKREAERAASGEPVIVEEDEDEDDGTIV